MEWSTSDASREPSVDPDGWMRLSCREFIHRFQYIESIGRLHAIREAIGEMLSRLTLEQDTGDEGNGVFP